MRNVLYVMLTLFCACGRVEKVKDVVPVKVIVPKKDEVVVFRFNEDFKEFNLTIGNDFKYHDSMLNYDSLTKSIDRPWTAIGVYKKKRDSLVVVHLRINEKDTSFSCSFNNIDSIMFGLSNTRNRKFYIVTNHDRGAWIMD